MSLLPNAGRWRTIWRRYRAVLVGPWIRVLIIVDFCHISFTPSFTDASLIVPFSSIPALDLALASSPDLLVNHLSNSGRWRLIWKRYRAVLVCQWISVHVHAMVDCCRFSFILPSTDTRQIIPFSSIPAIHITLTSSSDLSSDLLVDFLSNSDSWRSSDGAIEQYWLAYESVCRSWLIIVVSNNVCHFFWTLWGYPHFAKWVPKKLWLVPIPLHSDRGLLWE